MNILIKLKVITLQDRHEYNESRYYHWLYKEDYINYLPDPIEEDDY